MILEMWVNLFFVLTESAFNHTFDRLRGWNGKVKNSIRQSSTIKTDNQLWEYILGQSVEDGVKLRLSIQLSIDAFQSRIWLNNHSFARLTVYFRKLIPHYPIVARPLTEFLKANIEFNARSQYFGCITQTRKRSFDASMHGYGAVPM